MPVPTVKSCWCLGLRTAGLFFGFIAILADMVSVYLFVHINTEYHNTEDGIDGVWELLLASICMIVAAAWIYGIIKEKTRPMLPFLCLSFIGVTIFVFLPFIMLFYFSATNADPIKGTIVFLILIYIGGLAGYTWIVEYSLYKKIEEISIEKNEERNGV